MLTVAVVIYFDSLTNHCPETHLGEMFKDSLGSPDTRSWTKFNVWFLSLFCHFPRLKNELLFGTFVFFFCVEMFCGLVNLNILARVLVQPHIGEKG